MESRQIAMRDQFGKRVVLGVAIAFVLLELIVICGSIYFGTASPKFFTIAAARWVLTGVLIYGLLKRKQVARWITVVILGATAIGALFAAARAMGAAQWPWVAFQLGLSLVSVTFSSLLAASAGVGIFFARERSVP